MNRLLVLLVCGLSIFQLVGCQSPARNKSGIEVIIEGNGEFPEFLAGVWRADKDGWEFVFEPDGTISSAVITMGRVRMKPGEVTTVPMKMGGKGVFEPGEWMVYYTPVGRELMVKITLKNLYVELCKDTLEGKSTDIFAGPVSQNGKVWHAAHGLPEGPGYTGHSMGTALRLRRPHPFEVSQKERATRRLIE